MVIYNKKSKIEFRALKVISNAMEDVGTLLVFGNHK
jgi:hypothetical protein